MNLGVGFWCRGTRLLVWVEVKFYLMLSRQASEGDQLSGILESLWYSDQATWEAAKVSLLHERPAEIESKRCLLLERGSAQTARKIHKKSWRSLQGSRVRRTNGSAEQLSTLASQWPTLQGTRSACGGCSSKSGGPRLVFLFGKGQELCFLPPALQHADLQHVLCLSDCTVVSRNRARLNDASSEDSVVAEES